MFDLRARLAVRLDDFNDDLCDTVTTPAAIVAYLQYIDNKY